MQHTCRRKSKVKVVLSCPTLWTLYSSPWNSPGQNTGQNTRVGSLSLLQGNLPNLGIEPRSPRLQARSLPAEPQGKPRKSKECLQTWLLKVGIRGKVTGLRTPAPLPGHKETCPAFWSLHRRAVYTISQVTWLPELQTPRSESSCLDSYNYC